LEPRVAAWYRWPVRAAILAAVLCLAAAAVLPAARPARDAPAQDACGASGEAIPPARAGQRGKRTKRIEREVSGAAQLPGLAAHGWAPLAAACGLTVPAGRALPACSDRAAPALLAPRGPRVARSPPPLPA